VFEHLQTTSDPTWPAELEGVLGDSRAVPVLLTLVQDDRLLVQHASIYALREIGDRAAVGPLRSEYERRKADQDPNVLLPLLQTLRSFGEEVDPWFEPPAGAGC
jgi:HEAT repeat protein